jgi:hypothetical protein
MPWLHEAHCTAQGLMSLLVLLQAVCHGCLLHQLPALQACSWGLNCTPVMAAIQQPIKPGAVGLSSCNSSVCTRPHAARHCQPTACWPLLHSTCLFDVTSLLLRCTFAPLLWLPGRWCCCTGQVGLLLAAVRCQMCMSPTDSEAGTQPSTIYRNQVVTKRCSVSCRLQCTLLCSCSWPAAGCSRGLKLRHGQGYGCSVAERDCQLLTS